MIKGGERIEPENFFKFYTPFASFKCFFIIEFFFYIFEKWGGGGPPGPPVPTAMS